MRRHVCITLRAAAFILCAAFFTPAYAVGELKTVEHVDLARYLGVWHEQARYNSFFQDESCVNVTAEYGLRPDGRISVLNTCRDTSGKVTDQADGYANVADSATNARLRVCFFWPIFGDYWVIALADDYSWVIVSEPDRKFLWILTRDAKVDAGLLDDLVKRATDLGFDPSRLFFSQRS